MSIRVRDAAELDRSDGTALPVTGVEVSVNPNRRAAHRRTSRCRAVLLCTSSTLLVLTAVSCGDDESGGRTTVDSVDTTGAPTTEPVDVTDPTEATLPVDVTDPTEPTTPPTEPPTSEDVPVISAPSVVYATTGDPTDPNGTQIVFDPADGSILDEVPIDVEASQAAQDALPGGVISTVDLGDVSYAFDQVFYDAGTLNTDFYTDVDLCGQNVVTVESPNGSALPERAHVLSVSPDGRFVVTLSSECPEQGTMGADGVGTQVPFEATFEVFDAQQPELPGRILLGGVPALNVGTATFSGNGRFVALETFDDDHQYEVFDLESGALVDVGDGCTVDGTQYSRFIGPWIGGSSLALVLGCADGQQLVVRDLMPGGETLVVPITAGDSGFPTSAEVDYASFSTPANTWFLLCDRSAEQCSVGRGEGQQVVLSGVTDASFLPLGFYPGG